MRWGVPEQAADNHSTTELCLQEIQRCREVSLGPNFVVRSIINQSINRLSLQFGPNRNLKQNRSKLYLKYKHKLCYFSAIPWR